MPGKVVVTDHVFPDLEIEREALAAVGCELVYEGDLREPERLKRLTRNADAVLNCYVRMPREAIEELERCRIIARYGVGVDTIDLDAASERGIVVTNVPDYCRAEVSDHTLALILALARRLPKLDRSVQSGEWQATEAKPTFRLSEQSLGLVGFGRIARDVARKARAFGLRVLATDPFVAHERMAEQGVEPRRFSELLSESDFVSIHAPLTAETNHLIDAEALALMKPTAYLVNTSRGPLVDSAALCAALDSRRLAGTGLDVLEDEPLSADHPLRGRDNVIITPHTAFYSEEAVAELQRKAVTQIVKVLTGKRPDYPVNPETLGS